MNLAMTLDGKISTRNYTASGFTPKTDLEKLLELRVNADALLVGRGTLEADKMRLIIPDRVLKGRKQPLRCVISGKGEWDLTHPFFQVETAEELLFVTLRKAKEENEVAVDSIEEAVGYLFSKGIRYLHCEGGGAVVKSLMERDLVDELFLTWSGTTFFGGEEAPTISGQRGEYLPESRHYELISLEVGEEQECYLHYRKKKRAT